MTPPGPDDELEERRIVDRMERGEPQASLEEQAARRPYERIAQEIAGLPLIVPPDGWQERVLRSVDEPKPRGRMWLTIGVLVLAAAIVLFIWKRPTTPERYLAFEPAPGVPHRGADRGVVGDRLQLRGRMPGAFAELRVYRDDKQLVLRCPGDAGCSVDGGLLRGELVLAAPGTYRLLILGSDRPPPAPGALGFDVDLGELASAGAQVLTDVIHVD